MTTDTSEKGLETLIMRHMTGKLGVCPAARQLPAEPAEPVEPVEPESATDPEEVTELEEAVPD